MFNQASHRAMQGRRRLLATTSGAVLLATTLSAVHAQAQVASNEPATVGEVVVTASRRAQTVTSLPFNISAYGEEQLARANITSVASLTRQVPNFNIQDSGARSSASQIPIIRGLNASQPTGAAARYFQSPVGFYLGNAPITGSLPVFDVERIEVLRGPQGTLYGAGSLGGAVRIVPMGPELGEVSGLVTGSIGASAHSADPSYALAGAVNVPIGETMALRVNARHQYDGGFIDAHDVLKRQGESYVNGAPLLADPTDVAGSPAVYFNKKDYNYAKTDSVRAALLWEPTDAFSMTLAYDYAHSEGVGGNIDNNVFKGGPSPLDPRVVLEPTGDYERSIPMLEPWSRRTQLASLDASYDLGFATVSTTLAYGKTKGEVANDSTVALLGSPYGFFYTGTPANPRAVIPVNNLDSDRSYTQEIRIVSEAGGTIEYTAGAFFQQQKRYIGLKVYAPGASEQSFASGGARVPILLGGTYVPTLADSTAYIQDTNQDFKEASIYGDVTWNITKDWSLTGGARFFDQRFSSSLHNVSTLFLAEMFAENSDKSRDQIFKLNTSYRWSPGQQVYATWSQGFRRGGSNAFPTDQLIFEPAEMLTYEADRTDNFEIGAKGTQFGIYYSVSAFFIDWDKPQIDLSTPYNLFPIVANGSKAESKGVELELQGPIGPQGLSFSLGLAYSKARLSEDFSLPAGDGAGGVVPNAITGKSGDRLPGAPDWSGAGSVTYVQDLADGTLTYNLGFDFRGSTYNQLPSLSTNAPARRAPAYALFNGSLAYSTDNWDIELYGLNLADSRVRYASNIRTLASYAMVGDWGDAFAVSRPREVGLRLTRRW